MGGTKEPSDIGSRDIDDIVDRVVTFSGLTLCRTISIDPFL